MKGRVLEFYPINPSEEIHLKGESRQMIKLNLILVKGIILRKQKLLEFNYYM